MCLFEPIFGRYPTGEMCNNYSNCEGCPYNFDKDSINNDIIFDEEDVH